MPQLLDQTWELLHVDGLARTAGAGSGSLMLERFRAGAARLIAPLARLLNRLGVSPDLVTAVGTLGVMLGALICYPMGWLWQGTLVVTFFVLADMLDGLMAKISGTASTWGAFLDSSLDRLGDGRSSAACCSTSPTSAGTGVGGHHPGRADLRPADLLRPGSGRESRLRGQRRDWRPGPTGC